MILAFPISLMLILIKAYRVEQEVWLTLGTVLLGLGVLLIVVGFLVFGLLMIIYVKKKDCNEDVAVPTKISTVDTISNTNRGSIDAITTHKSQLLRLVSLSPQIILDSEDDLISESEPSRGS